jgi:Fur family ferric uptake transcriptional regulator
MPKMKIHDVDSNLSLGMGNLKNSKDVVIKREGFDQPTLRRLIRDMGLKITEQRLAILETLSAGRVHVTAQEVFERVHKKYSEIGFATVYRFLKQLSKAGFVTEVRLGSGGAKYELTPSAHHDHLTCSDCGKVVEFENEDIENLQRLVAINHGFELTGHVLELYGICSSCQKKQNNKST